jgi:hypothetical protein
MDVPMELLNKIESATMAQRVDYINELYNKWTFGSDESLESLDQGPGNNNNSTDHQESIQALLNNNFFESVKKILEVLEIPVNDFRMGTYDNKMALSMVEIAFLRKKTVESDEFKKSEFQNDSATLLRKINVIVSILTDADNAIRYVYKLKETCTNYNYIGTNNNNAMPKFNALNLEKITPWQTLLLYILEKLSRDGYSRYGDDCFEKVYTPDGHYTHCWARKMSIKEYIYSSCQKDYNPEMWQLLTNKAGNADNTEKYLLNHVGMEFSTLNRSRDVIAFNNGIYFTYKKGPDGPTDEFIPYGTKPIGLNIIAANYIKTNFDTRTIRRPNEPDYRYNDWYNIIIDFCPAFKSIMDYQEWPEEVQRWLCVMIGRNLYNTGQLDNWQIVAFFLGQAGTGKSTMLMYILKKIYQEGDVVVMSNNIEGKFGLWNIYDKLMYVAPEVKNNFGLEQADFQTIISGEGMNIPRKNLKPITIPAWLVPGMYAGNELPGYSDNSGSIARRILPFMFTKKVTKGDTSMPVRLEAELSYIIHACNRAYLEKVASIENIDIWSVVPQYFLNNRSEMAEQTNPVTHFVKSGKIIFGVGKYIKETEFIEKFKLHCHEHNLQFNKTKTNSSIILSILNDIAPVPCEYKKEFRIDKKKGNFFIGIDYKEPEQDAQDKIKLEGLSDEEEGLDVHDAPPVKEK